MKRKEQSKNNEEVRMNGKGKNTSTGKNKAVDQSLSKKSSKNSKTIKQLVKAKDASGTTAPVRKIKHDRQTNEHKASYVSLEDQHKIIGSEKSTARLDVDPVGRTIPLRHEAGNKAEAKSSDLHRSSSEQNNLRSSDKKTAKFLEKCEGSKHLKVNRRKAAEKELVPIQLPEGLPSKLLLKALLHEQQTFTVLRQHVIIPDQEDDNAIDVQLDSITTEQLTTLVKELDELVGQFTARNYSIQL